MSQTKQAKQGKNIVVATLGITWEIIAEIMGTLCFDEKVDFYCNSKEPNRKEIDSLRMREKEILGEYGTIDELWLISTEDGKTKENAECVKNWMKCYASCEKVNVRHWLLHGVSDIGSSDSANKFHDLILRVMAYAQLCKGEHGHVITSLAGGRKTMSADIQDAAYCFGCDMTMHVLALTPELFGLEKKFHPEIKLNGEPLQEDSAKIILPIALDGYESSPIFDQLLKDASYEALFDGYDAQTEKEHDSYYVSMGECQFLTAVKTKRDLAKYFYSSYESSHGFIEDTFPCLYTLPEKSQLALKNLKIGASGKNQKCDLKILKSLPKSDVHCHLGGCLTIQEMVEVAKTLKGKLDALKQENETFRKWKPKGPKTGESWKDWRSRVANELQIDWRLVAPAYLLSFEGNEGALLETVYGDYALGLNESNDSQFVGIASKKTDGMLDLSPYEILGDLQGTSLLCHKETLAKATKILLKKSYDDGVRYLEVRCSPINYGNSGFDSEVVVKTIIGAIEKFRAGLKNDDMRVSILFIASRHSDDSVVQRGIELYQKMWKQDSNGENFRKYFRGFDLAGNESAKSPKDMREVFTQVMQDCMSITIHAGETMPVQNVWEAVYHLNAERIGHGLTLDGHEDLINKFRDRRIGIEMCPSSNYQIVGFRDNYIDTGKTRCIKGAILGEYPLKKYLDEKLCVSVNTDDPGISMTGMTNELLKAGRLTKGGLSLWDIFRLIYNGFSMAFLPYEEKNRMVAEMNSLVYGWLRENMEKLAGYVSKGAN